MPKGVERKKISTKANLNLMLWLYVSLFSVVIIVLFAVVQSILISDRMRKKVQEDTKSAGQEIVLAIHARPMYSAEITRLMQSVSNQYNVSTYLFTSDGKRIYPEISEEDREQFSKIAEEIIERMKTISDKENTAAVFSSKTQYALAFSVKIASEEYFLYVANSYNALNGIIGSLKWITVIIVLFAVALAFIVSGFVSMIVTKPISEVTEKAKKLAGGDYEIKFGSDEMFCTEVAELSEALDYARTEISKADEIQKELIANVSHDFKTPLTMIKAYASMIQEISGDDPEKRQKHTQVIIDETDRLTSLVTDLLDISRIRAGTENFDFTVFNLSEEVYRVANRFEYLSETQGYVIETDIDEDLYTYASRERVEQVLYNLIGNAVNYTGADKRVVVRLKAKELGARFEVIDSGTGISQEELPTIWERYYRSSEMHKRPVKGTGLGLSIVKTILEKHNIPYGVQSETGKGSCFWVEFPNPPEDNR